VAFDRRQIKEVLALRGPGFVWTKKVSLIKQFELKKTRAQFQGSYNRVK
jgi:hypothetical protein